MSSNTEKKATTTKTSPLKSLALLADPTNYRILRQIKNHPNKPVNRIYRTLDLEQSVVSSKLSKLKKENFVIGNKKGREVLYVLNDRTFDKVANRITEKFI